MSANAIYQKYKLTLELKITRMDISKHSSFVIIFLFTSPINVFGVKNRQAMILLRQIKYVKCCVEIMKEALIIIKGK